MDVNKIIARAKAILLTPRTEWPVIAGEAATTQSIYTEYVLLLAALPSIAAFIKGTVFGYNTFILGTYRMSVGAGLTSALTSYVLSLIGIFVLALVIDALAPTFGATKDRVQAVKTAAYAYTAGWIGGIGVLVPGIGTLIALAGGIYGIYLLYLGLPHTMKCPAEKATGYTVVTLIAAIVLYAVIGAVTGGIIARTAPGGPGAGGLFGGVASRSGGGFDGGGLGGPLAEVANNLEKAGKEMEEAQKSGNAADQAAAAGKVLGAVLGGGAAQVESLSPDRMKAFLPAALGGMKLTESSASRNSAMGMQVSEASARYSDDAGRNLNLEITDMGSAKGLMGLAAWVNVEEDKRTQTGYEKTYKQGENMIHEEWDNTDKRGEYSVVLAQRFAVKANGEVTSIDELKSAVSSVDLAGLVALRNEGVKAQ
ncbi:MAG: Yip1 family protein [Steroidobacteraceae bacterium]